MIVTALAAVAAAVAIWSWALRPLGFVSYLTSTGATDIAVIRQYWPHRLIDPTWISATSNGLDLFSKWHMTETVARLSVVGVLWFIVVGGVVYRFIRKQEFWSNQGSPAKCSSPQSNRSSMEDFRLHTLDSGPRTL